MFDIYTDGACRARVGGWAALILTPGERRTLSGKAEDTTSNRMELSAAINAVESLPSGSEVTLYSDSEYLVKTMTLGWRRNANLDLWQKLDALAEEHQIRWEWVKGHASIPGNEYVNQLAGFEAGVTKTRPELDHFLGPEATEDAMEDAMEAAPSLTHLDQQGRVEMVDVGWKPVTDREAVAWGYVSMQPETLRLIQESLIKKGDVLTIAQLAGIMGGKRTSELIPLCHPLPLDKLDVELELDPGGNRVKISALARTSAKTGVEMEALTAVSVAALTVYDMCKGVDRGMTIGDIRLVRKSGGQSGDIHLEV
ncbi:MAG: cyclic pyranopterin monophosphate synthase MoaC [Stenotrophomonas maltophilia]